MMEVEESVAEIKAVFT